METFSPSRSPKTPESFRLLPTPLQSIPMASLHPDDLVAKGRGHLSVCTFQTQEEARSGSLQIGKISLPRLQLNSVKTTPLQLKSLVAGWLSVGLSYAGSVVYEQDGRRLEAASGDLLFCPNNGGIISTGLCSGIACHFEPKRLVRTLAVMLGHDDGALDLTQAHTLPTSSSSVSGKPGGLMRELCDFMDRLLHEDALLLEAMGLEEQFFRSLAIEWLHANGKLDGLRRRQHRQHATRIDDLVDFILANLDRPITLTDLEEQSNYSGRQLQYLFRSKFDCTPLQFVRRQRLKFAMARLEQAQPSDTIAGIARELGYRNTSSFSADFFRQFGVHPSTILRSRRHRSARPGSVARPRRAGAASLKPISGASGEPSDQRSCVGTA